MKVFLIGFITCVLSLTTLSCGESTSERDNSGDPATEAVENTPEEPVDIEEAASEPEEDRIEETAPSAGPSVNLEMCYATSIHLPESEFGPENVFDGNMLTHWVTMPGAGDDEGIYFSFEDMTYIHSINIETLPSSDEYEEIMYIVPYINGMDAGLFRMDGNPIIIDADVKTVFLRIEYLVSVERFTPGYDDNLSYRGNLPVGISEISLTVPEGEHGYTSLDVVPMSSVSGRIEASSALEPVEAYNPDFLFDSRTGFGWADGNTDDSGEGEYLTFIFDSPRTIEKIRIWNGYQRSETHFSQNERAASVTMGADDDLVEYDLEDTMDPQTITLENPFLGSEFKIEFPEIYQGSTYTDLVISELRFFDGQEWFILESGGNEERKLAVLEWAESTTAGIFMDRNLVAISEDGIWDETSQSLVIRSNGSFVLWKKQWSDGGEETTYADGNWQILDDNSMRVFGKIHHVGEYYQGGYDEYSGVQPENRAHLDRTTIFSDTLRFDEHHMESSRGLFFNDFLF